MQTIICLTELKETSFPFHTRINYKDMDIKYEIKGMRKK